MPEPSRTRCYCIGDKLETLGLRPIKFEQKGTASLYMYQNVTVSWIDSNIQLMRGETTGLFMAITDCI
jgi:hypothetical protein